MEDLQLNGPPPGERPQAGKAPRRTPVAPAQQPELALAPATAQARPAQPMTPMDMLAVAVQRGASVDELGKLWEIAEKVRQQQAQAAYVQAMNRFKQDPPTIEKTRTANVTRKDGSAGHSYKYANLADVCGAVVRALAAVNISHSWATVQKDGHVAVTCTLTHEQGHGTSTMLAASLDTTGSKNNLQALGSTVSYLERYTLLAACGLAVDDEQDDDGASGEERTELQQEARNMRQRASPADVAASRLRGKAPTADPQLLSEARAAADKGHAVFGPHWRSLSEEQRRSLSGELADLQMRASAAKVQ